MLSLTVYRQVTLPLQMVLRTLVLKPTAEPGTLVKNMGGRALLSNLMNLNSVEWLWGICFFKAPTCNSSVYVCLRRWWLVTHMHIYLHGLMCSGDCLLANSVGWNFWIGLLAFYFGLKQLERCRSRKWRSCFYEFTTAWAVCVYLSVWGRLLREVCVCVYGRSEVLLK